MERKIKTSKIKQKRKPYILRTSRTETKEMNEQERIKIVFVGAVGSGRSTLINTLRGLKPICDDAAPCGINIVTEKAANCTFPTSSNIILRDMPGMNSGLYSLEEYCKIIEIDDVDLVLVLQDNVLLETDVQITEYLKTMNKPFLYVKTHIDFDVLNYLEDEEIDITRENLNSSSIYVDIVKKKIRHSLYTDISDNKMYETDFIDKKHFIVSGKIKHIEQYDMVKLIKAIIEYLPIHKQNLLLLNIFSFNADIIKEKIKILEDRIKYYMSSYMSSNLISIPGLKSSIDLTLVLNFSVDSSNYLYISEQRLINAFDNESIKFSVPFLTMDKLFTLLSEGSKDMDIGFEQHEDSTLQYITTYISCKFVLHKLEEHALQMIKLLNLE